MLLTSFSGIKSFTYLESEEQKLSFFCNQLGIDKKILPHKRYSGAIKGDFTDRYFVDKFPMFYNPAVSLSPVMTFSFIDPGFESMDSFKTHVDAYLTLFTKLSQLRFYYVATRETNFERAGKLFHGTFRRLWNPAAPCGLFDYFRTRRTWDEKNYGKLSEHDVLFMNQGKERFGNPGMENLYQRWRAGEITENTVRSESVKFQMPSQVTFISATVNGQAALFERHPHQPVNVPVKSSEETSFSGDFTSEHHPGLEISDGKSRQMRQKRQRNGARPKHDQRRERPHRAAKSRPDPFGLRGSLPPLAAGIRSSCFGRAGEAN